MTLSKREKHIGIVVLAVVVLCGGYLYVFEPLVQWSDRIKTDTESVKGKLADSETLFRRETRLKPVWDELKASGLTSNASAAGVQANERVQNWMRSSGVALTNIKPAAVKATKDGKFQVSTIQFEATGDSRSLAKLILKLETADIPVSINEMQLRPIKPGVDGLKIEMSISTLSQAPEGESKPAERRGTSSSLGRGGADGAVARAEFGARP